MAVISRFIKKNIVLQISWFLSIWINNINFSSANIVKNKEKTKQLLSENKKTALICNNIKEISLKIEHIVF